MFFGRCYGISLHFENRSSIYSWYGSLWREEGKTCVNDTVRTDDVIFPDIWYSLVCRLLRMGHHITSVLIKTRKTTFSRMKSEKRATSMVLRAPGGFSQPSKREMYTWSSENSQYNNMLSEKAMRRQVLHTVWWISVVRLQGKFEIAHSWEWKG